MESGLSYEYKVSALTGTSLSLPSGAGRGQESLSNSLLEFQVTIPSLEKSPSPLRFH